MESTTASGVINKMNNEKRNFETFIPSGGLLIFYIILALAVIVVLYLIGHTFAVYCYPRITSWCSQRIKQTTKRLNEKSLSSLIVSSNSTFSNNSSASNRDLELLIETV